MSRSSVVRSYLHKKLIGSNLIKDIATYSGLFIVGDIGSQWITKYRHTLEKSNHDDKKQTLNKVDSKVDSKLDMSVDVGKLKFTVGWGIAGGYAIHKWYYWLDHKFKYTLLGSQLNSKGWDVKTFSKPGARILSGLIFGKVILDLLFDIPLYGTYLGANMIYEDVNKKLKDNKKIEPVATLTSPIHNDYVNKFKNMYIADCAFWFPANMINFFFVSNKHRVLFFSAATSLWAIILPLICRNNH